MSEQVEWTVEEMEALHQVLKDYEATIAELRAQLAAQAEWETANLRLGPEHVIVSYDEHDRLTGVDLRLPGNWRLQRRIQE